MSNTRVGKGAFAMQPPRRCGKTNGQNQQDHGQPRQQRPDMECIIIDDSDSDNDVRAQETAAPQHCGRKRQRLGHAADAEHLASASNVAQQGKGAGTYEHRDKRPQAGAAALTVAIGATATATRGSAQPVGACTPDRPESGAGVGVKRGTATGDEGQAPGKRRMGITAAGSLRPAPGIEEGQDAPGQEDTAGGTRGNSRDRGAGLQAEGGLPGAGGSAGPSRQAGPGPAPCCYECSSTKTSKGWRSHKTERGKSVCRDCYDHFRRNNTYSGRHEQPSGQGPLSRPPSPPQRGTQGPSWPQSSPAQQPAAPALVQPPESPPLQTDNQPPLSKPGASGTRTTSQTAASAATASPRSSDPAPSKPQPSKPRPPQLQPPPPKPSAPQPQPAQRPVATNAPAHASDEPSSKPSAPDAPAGSDSARGARGAAGSAPAPGVEAGEAAAVARPEDAWAQAMAELRGRPGVDAKLLAQLQSLAPGEQVSDNVLYVWADVMQVRNLAQRQLPGGRSCRFFNSFFYRSLFSDYGDFSYERVKRHVRPGQHGVPAGGSVLDMDLLFFIIRDTLKLKGGDSVGHWWLAVMDAKAGAVRVFDSLGKRLEAQDSAALHLKQWADEESRAEKRPPPLRPVAPLSWATEYPEGVPQQGNGVDCGVFTMLFAEYIAAGEPVDEWPTQRDIPQERARLVLELTAEGCTHTPEVLMRPAGPVSAATAKQVSAGALAAKAPPPSEAPAKAQSAQRAPATAPPPQTGRLSVSAQAPAPAEPTRRQQVGLRKPPRQPSVPLTAPLPSLGPAQAPLVQQVPVTAPLPQLGPSPASAPRAGPARAALSHGASASPPPSPPGPSTAPPPLPAGACAPPARRASSPPQLLAEGSPGFRHLLPDMSRVFGKEQEHGAEPPAKGGKAHREAVPPGADAVAEPLGDGACAAAVAQGVIGAAGAVSGCTARRCCAVCGSVCPEDDWLEFSGPGMKAYLCASHAREALATVPPDAVGTSTGSREGEERAPPGDAHTPPVSPMRPSPLRDSSSAPPRLDAERPQPPPTRPAPPAQDPPRVSSSQPPALTLDPARVLEPLPLLDPPSSNKNQVARLGPTLTTTTSSSRGQQSPPDPQKGSPPYPDGYDLPPPRQQERDGEQALQHRQQPPLPQQHAEQGGSKNPGAPGDGTPAAEPALTPERFRDLLADSLAQYDRATEMFKQGLRSLELAKRALHGVIQEGVRQLGEQCQAAQAAAAHATAEAEAVSAIAARAAAHEDGARSAEAAAQEAAALVTSQAAAASATVAQIAAHEDRIRAAAAAAREAVVQAAVHAAAVSETVAQTAAHEDGARSAEAAAREAAAQVTSQAAAASATVAQIAAHEDGARSAEAAAREAAAQATAQAAAVSATAAQIAAHEDGARAAAAAAREAAAAATAQAAAVSATAAQIAAHEDGARAAAAAAREAAVAAAREAAATAAREAASAAAREEVVAAAREAAAAAAREAVAAAARETAAAAPREEVVVAAREAAAAVAREAVVAAAREAAAAAAREAAAQMVPLVVGALEARALAPSPAVLQRVALLEQAMGLQSVRLDVLLRQLAAQQEATASVHAAHIADHDVRLEALERRRGS